MSTSHLDIFRTALEMPEAERMLLATRLWESISGRPPGLSVDDPDFEQELHRRAADDPAESIPWEVVRQQLRDDLKS